MVDGNMSRFDRRVGTLVGWSLGLGEFHLHSGGLWLSGLGIPIPVGMEKEPHKSQDEDGEHKADDSEDQWSHPFGPAEQIAGISAFKVQIH